MSDVKRCAACGKENPVSEMEVCMHHQMHRYVCDSKCMTDFYNRPKKPTAAELEVKVAALEAELAKLRAEQEPAAKLQWPEIVALVNEVLGSEVHKFPCERGSIGHEMTGINFNSLARIIDRVRYRYAAPQPSAVPDAITMTDVMRAWEYAEDHPHKYLRGTTNWCAAVAHSLNQRNPSAPVQGDEAGGTRRICHACATWSRNKACPVCDPQMSNMTLQLLEALEGLVTVNEQHNAAIQRVTGTPAGWKDDYLNQARAAIAAARKGEGK